MPTPPTRRQFLARAAILAAAAPTFGAFLAACSKSGPASSGPSLTIAAPDNPIKWPIPDDNKPIADGLAPEKGATLKIYNYADYLSPQAVKAFEDQYGIKLPKIQDLPKPPSTPQVPTPTFPAPGGGGTPSAPSLPSVPNVSTTGPLLDYLFAP